MIDENPALLQTVHAGGELQPQGRLLGVGQEGPRKRQLSRLGERSGKIRKIDISCIFSPGSVI